MPPSHDEHLGSIPIRGQRQRFRFRFRIVFQIVFRFRIVFQVVFRFRSFSKMPRQRQSKVAHLRGAGTKRGPEASPPVTPNSKPPADKHLVTRPAHESPDRLLRLQTSIPEGFYHGDPARATPPPPLALPALPTVPTSRLVADERDRLATQLRDAQNQLRSKVRDCDGRVVRVLCAVD